MLERIGRRHDRGMFDCGSADLNDYLARFARQNDTANLSRTYVAVRPGDSGILGYFTVRSGSVAFTDLPEEARRRLPRYPIPVLHLARLAVDRRMQGERIGEGLLVEALRLARTVSDRIGILAVEVVASSESARRFYLRYGFKALRDDRLHLYLPVRTIDTLPFGDPE